jgi:hypothetical protein
MSEKRKPREGLFRRALRLVPKLLRVSVFVVVVWVLAIFFAAHRVEAEVQEIMLGLGAEMMQMPDAQDGRVRQMRFNGTPIQFRTSRVDQPLADVLDFFEQRCQERDGRIAEQLEELMARNGESGEADPSDLDGTLRFDTSERGYVACLDMGEERQDHEDLIGRIGSFLDSGDLSEVGHMRYLFAQRADEEGTFMVSIFSDQPVRLFDIFPTEGDAPGSDPVDIPRPPEARRLLSAFEEGRPYGMFVYTHAAGQEASDLERTYRERLMPSQGWSAVSLRDGERVRVDGSLMSVWSKDERVVTLVFSEGPDGQATTSVMTSDEDPSS